MKVLANELEQTRPFSLLTRKLTRLGLHANEHLLDLAVQRGCRHYASCSQVRANDPGREILPDDELAVAMMSGGRAYEPMLIRCAAQLIRGDSVDATRLAFLAKKEKAERVLAHIAHAGIEHDPKGMAFWCEVLGQLPDCEARTEPKLPHWSRFVSMPGWQRGKTREPEWLVPSR